MSRFTWLLVGLLIGAAAATLLARRTAVPAAASTAEGAALDPLPPVQGGRHARVPPDGSTGPSAG